MLTRRADIKTGWSCNCNCLFCVVGDLLYTGDRSTAEVKQELIKARKTSNGVVFTGGEPTMRKDFLDLLKMAKALKYEVIQIQTNGKMFAYMDFVDACIEAGANEFSPAIHGHVAKLHDGLVRVQGSFDQIIAGIKHLRQRDQRIVANTVVNKANMKHMPAMAEMLCDLEVDQFQLAFVHPQGHVQRYFDQMVPKISDAAPYIQQALLVGEKRGVKCMAEAMPYCHMQGYERFVSELYIPATELLFKDLAFSDYKENRLTQGKVRFEQCNDCRYLPICEGPWKEYPERMGSEEFQPVDGPLILSEQLVLDGWFEKLGEKLSEFSLFDQEGQMRKSGEFEGKTTVLYFYPEDFSPGCTTQACGMRDLYGEILASGAVVLGISPDSPDQHKKFKTEHRLPFDLLSDPKAELASAYGFFERGWIRGTVVLGPSGELLHRVAGENPNGHARRTLQLLHQLAKGNEKAAV